MKQFLRINGASNRSVSAIFFGLLAGSFLVEGIVAKSFIFSGNDPVLQHYVASAVIGVCMFLALAAAVKIWQLSVTEVFFVLGATLWSLWSSLVSGSSDNLFATFAFLLTVVFAYLSFPRVALAARWEPWRMIMWLCIAVSILSLLLWVVDAGLVYDRESGRFSGALISVAVACNIFFFGAVFSAYAARNAETLQWNWFFRIMAFFCFTLLYLTRTRSLLVECIFCMFVVLVTDSNGKLAVKRLFGAVLVAVALIAAGLFVSVFSDISVDDVLVQFRLADDASLTLSRSLNWDFALQRIEDKPLFGEGMLTKQSEGGLGGIGREAGGTYSVLYDPHSLPLSLAVQAGLPFMVMIMSLLLLVYYRYVRAFGIWGALAAPEFVIGFVYLLGMILSGGDMTSLGNTVERIYWIIVGVLAYKANLKFSQRINVRPARSSIGGMPKFYQNQSDTRLPGTTRPTRNLN